MRRSQWPGPVPGMGRASLVVTYEKKINLPLVAVGTANPKVFLPSGPRTQHTSSSHQPVPTPSTIQRRPQFFSEYQRFLPLPIAVLT
jgi:hypothetical protein